MDRKAIIVLVVSFALILLWPKIMNELYPPPPKSTNEIATATNDLPKDIKTPVAETVTSPAPAAPQMPDDAPEKLLVVTSDNALYTFTSRGGGLKRVELKNYREAIVCGRPVPGEKQMAGLNTQAPLPVFSLLGEGIEGGSFSLSERGNTVRAERTLPNGLVVIKEFEIGANYLLQAKVRFENRSGEPLIIPNHELVVGTATPMTVHDESPTLGMFWYNGAKAEHIDAGWFANRTLGCIPGTPRTRYQGGLNNVAWSAVHNQFFTLAVIPREPAPGITSQRIDLPPPEKEVVVADPKALLNPFGFQTALAYPAITLARNEGLERQYTIYAGPKEYNTLARLGEQMKNELDLVMDFGGFFGFFAKLLLLSMNGLHAIGFSYGWAIVGITVIIKILFWPLTNASTKSMKRMAALQPQMKAIADKYKDDPAKKNQKTMEFMKEHKVSPLGGCLPMLLQIPVFFGFYKMLQSAIELRGASFLWACDLSQADTIWFIPFLNDFPLNPMPLIMGATMLLQARLTPMSPSMDPMQQKIMRYMPLMFIFILYRMSAGLTLYWTVQNLLTIAQMKMTKTDDAAATVKPGVPGKPAKPARPTPPASPKKKK